MSPSQSGTRGRPKGSPKTGGRKPGTPNKVTASLLERLAALNYDPLLELVHLANDPKTPLEMRIHVHLALFPYLYPKRKPVDGIREQAIITNVITELDGAGGITDVAAEPTPED
jgi:hypothetical protein